MKKLSVMVATLALCLGGSALAADSAQDIWKARCKGCHGEDGKAKTKVGEKEKIPDMSNPEWQKRHADEDIKKVISEGSTQNTKMKAFKDKLSVGEIDSLVQYIRTLKAK